MLRLLSCMLLSFSVTSGQVAPYGSTPPVPFGSTPVPFTPSIPTPITPTIPPIVPPIGPFNPFGPSPRPFLPPGYNNPYYNAPGGPAVPILTYSSDHVGDGTYSFSYSTADGKQAQESGYLKDAYIDNAGEPQGTQVVQGSYAYVAPDGTPIQVSYIADENGFRPSGVHIPADGKGLPPPLPLVDGKKDNRIIDPFNRFDPYNSFDPYSNRNRFNNNNYYNNGGFNPPYDPRYPYDPAHPNRYNRLNRYNPYRPTSPLYGKDVTNKDEQKQNSV